MRTLHGLTRTARRVARAAPLAVGTATLLAVAAAAAVPAGHRTGPRPVERGAERERWPAPDAVLQSGTLSFTGHSTVGAFVGTTSAVTGGVTGDADVANARGWVEAPVATLATGNALRDRDLRATMEVAKYPTLRFDLVGVDVASPAAPPDTVRTALRGRLTIHGVARDVSIPATLVAAGDAIDVAGGFPLDLADYRIGGLTRFLGALRMQRNVEVRFRLRFDATSHTTTRTTTRTTTQAIER